MKIENTFVEGFIPSIRAMRNPLDSWKKSDSKTHPFYGFQLGDADSNLSQRLTNAGSEHCKHLRMIHVWVDMTLPRYIWSEFDTYKFNTKISCSTMHTIHKRFLTKDDFIDGEISDAALNELNEIIRLMQNAETTEDKNELRTILKRKLPEGFLQKRTLDLNYGELLNIYHQRKNHKLKEWRVICDWILDLPYFKQLTGVE